MTYSPPIKDAVFGAAEALRKALAAWTGEVWLWADQDMSEDFPLGIIQVISSAPQGRSWSVIEDDKETAYTSLRATAQAAFIEKAARGADAPRSMFRPSSVLASVRDALALQEFKFEFRKALGGVAASIVSAGDVRPEVQGGETGLFVPASLDIEMDVFSRTQPQAEAPCVGRAQAPAINIRTRR